MESEDRRRMEVPPPRTFQLPERIDLAAGGTLKNASMVFETYGNLTPEKDNAVLVCHALSGSHHAAGHYAEEQKPGWWDALIGPGRAIDTDRLFVVSSNNLGGCHGSTGPQSIGPDGEAYGAAFPQVRVCDWVNTQAMLADYLGIACWHAVIGGSLGGMQALEWAVRYPERVHHCIAIAAAASLSTQNIAFNFVARKAILSAREANGMSDAEGYARGMGLARMLGHLTYLSERGMAARFGREASTREGGNRFEIEQYLSHLAARFIESGFDADTYLLMTHALDHFELAGHADGDIVRALEPATCRFLIISFDSDWRFPPVRSRELTRALLQAGKSVSMLEISADKGHDSFLFSLPRYDRALNTFLLPDTT